MGGLAIWCWGGRWKRWHNDDGVEVEGWTTETAQPSLLPTSRGTLPLTAGVQQECGPLLRRDTSTTAPNHPHNTDALHSAKRPGAGGRSTPGAWGKHCITQPHSGRTVGGGRRAVEDAPSASWQGGNTPRTPQARGRVLEAEDRDRIADGTGRRLRPSGGMIGSIGGAPLCAQPRLGGWGRLGLGKGYRCVMWLKGHGPSKSRIEVENRVST